MRLHHADVVKYGVIPFNESRGKIFEMAPALLRVSKTGLEQKKSDPEFPAGSLQPTQENGWCLTQVPPFPTQ